MGFQSYANEQYLPQNNNYFSYEKIFHFFFEVFQMKKKDNLRSKRVYEKPE